MWKRFPENPAQGRRVRDFFMLEKEFLGLCRMKKQEKESKWQGGDWMDEMKSGALVIGGVAFMMMLLGLYMLQGKGAFLIAGYNTMPKEEKAKYDGPAMARFIGKLLFALAFSMLFWLAGMLLEKSWMFYIGVALFLGFTGAALIYMNTGGRFLKQPPTSGHNKNK